MASKGLLNRLKFRAYPTPSSLPLKSITIRVAGTTRPEPSVRKFARNFVPVLLYKFPELKVSQLKSTVDEPSSVVIVDAGGAERIIAFEGKTDRTLYCEVTGMKETDLAEPTPCIVKHKDQKRNKSGTAKTSEAVPAKA